MSDVDKGTASQVKAKNKIVQANTTRLNTVLAFWAIVLLGLPFWWTTTSIERHPLPAREVAALSRQRCPLELPVLLDLSHSQWQGSDILGTLNGYTAASDRWKCLRFASAPPGTRHPLINDIPSHITTPGQLVRLLMPGTTDREDGVDPRVAKYSSNYKLVYSFLWQEPHDEFEAPTWEVDHAFEKHIFPIASSLAPLFNFTVETQIQHFAPLTIEPTTDEDGRSIIEEDQLKAFVNSAEWNLASVASLDPALHFVLYVPKKDSPLRIRLADGRLSESNAFISPQWGGVALSDPVRTRDSSTVHYTAADLDDTFAIFAQQMQTLLGVPQLLHTWPDRINAMLRSTALMNAKETVGTLEAVIKLANEIRNMRVAKSVDTGVRAAISQLRLAQSAAEVGDLQKAFLHSARAREYAEEAFFDPDMLALLYFPAEHVYAVYTPLFGPIAVPLILSLIREWRERKARRSQPSPPHIRIPSIPQSWPYNALDYRRMDETPDSSFYAYPRFVTHIDDRCIANLNQYYGSVLPAKGRILDLASSWISHLPRDADYRVFGVGMNQAELAANEQLNDGFAVIDLNADTRLKDFADASFDTVICSVSIDYLTSPREVLAEVARVLKPGASVHCSFSNRCFPTKVIGRWLRIDEEERCDMVAHAMAFAGGTDEPSKLFEQIEIVTVLPRSSQGDPLWVVRARRAVDAS